MNPIRQIRARQISKELAHLTNLYNSVTDDQEIEAFQLSQLNSLWSNQIRKLPAFMDASVAAGYPTHFESIEHFTATIPSLDRRTLSQNVTDYCTKEPKAERFRMTGGSTAEPIKLPAWNCELKQVAASQWLGRSWQGVSPSDRLFLLWGHSHLLGSGLKGKINALKRQFADLALGYCRASAYDLSRQVLMEAGERLIGFAPSYLYGYSVALDQFARANTDKRDALRNLNLKCIQATAERFPSAESKGIIEDIFGCPVVMEYGAMETGQIAATAPGGNGYRVYWRDYLLEGIRQEDGNHKVLVTSLYPRATALVRYEIGDTIQLHSGAADLRHAVSIKEFLEVGGRCNHGVCLPDGTFFHSEVFTHCVRDLKVIEAYQVVQQGAHLQLHYLGSRDLMEHEASATRSRFMKVDRRLGDVELVRVSQLRKNAAGKTQMVVVDQG